MNSLQSFKHMNLYRIWGWGGEDYLPTSNFLSESGVFTANDLERICMDLEVEPSPSFSLMLDALELCRLNFLIQSLRKS